MKTKKLLPLLLILTMLLGCTPAQRTEPVPPAPPAVETPEPDPILEPVPPPEPAPELPALPWAVYLYTSGSRSLAVNSRGEVVLEVSDGELSLLRDEDGVPRAIGHCFFGDLEETEEGITVAKKYWMDVYDLDGTLLMEHVPGNYGEVWGDVLFVRGNDCLYRLSDGQLLYEDIFTAYGLGETIFVQPSSEEPGGFLLDREGNFLKDLPPETGAEHGYVRDGKGYLETRFADGRQGLLDARGELLLEPLNDVVSRVNSDRVVVTRDGTEHVLDLHTGEILVSLPKYSIVELYPEAMICSYPSKDPQESRWRRELLDDRGNLLLDRSFEDILWADGVFIGIDTFDGTRSALACKADGTELWRLDMPEAYFGIVGHWGVYGEDVADQGTRFYRVDLRTGERFLLNQMPASDSSEPPWYWSDAIPYILLGESNAQGWERCRLVALEDGTVAVEDLREFQYLGGDVFLCRKGFDRGLMCLDGTWLYKERAFDDWNEE